MKTVPAAKFKANCLALMDKVQETGEFVVITKHGKPVAKLVPISRNDERARVQALIEEIKETRRHSGLKHTTMEEILEWRKEGRR